MLDQQRSNYCFNCLESIREESFYYIYVNVYDTYRIDTLKVVGVA